MDRALDIRSGGRVPGQSAPAVAKTNRAAFHSSPARRSGGINSWTEELSRRSDVQTYPDRSMDIGRSASERYQVATGGAKTTARRIKARRSTSGNQGWQVSQGIAGSNCRRSSTLLSRTNGGGKHSTPVAGAEIAAPLIRDRKLQTR